MLKSEIAAERGELEDAVGQSGLIVAEVREADSESPDQWMWHRVRFLARAGDFDGARAVLDSLRELVPETPDHPNGYYWAAKGWLDYETADYPSACTDFEQASAWEPWLVFGYSLGLAYLKAGRFDETVVQFEKQMTRFEDDRAAYPIEAVKMYYFLGVAYQELGRAQEAAAMLREFLEIWKDADPAFDPLRSDARRRLTRLAS
jgi:tetratricopeptide (TPR) repeat protein